MSTPAPLPSKAGGAAAVAHEELSELYVSPRHHKPFSFRDSYKRCRLWMRYRFWDSWLSLALAMGGMLFALLILARAGVAYYEAAELQQRDHASWLRSRGGLESAAVRTAGAKGVAVDGVGSADEPVFPPVAGALPRPITASNTAFPSLILVTAVSERNFPVARYLFHSVYAARARIVVYDVGLNDAQRLELQSHWSHVVTPRRFEFWAQKPHFHPHTHAGHNTGADGDPAAATNPIPTDRAELWKPLILREVLDDSQLQLTAAANGRSDVLWLDPNTYLMDAGVLIRQALLPALRDPKRCPKGLLATDTGSTRVLNHDGQSKMAPPVRIGNAIDKAMFRHPLLAGADTGLSTGDYRDAEPLVASDVIGVRYGSVAHRQIISEWVQCVVERDCVAPPRSPPPTEAESNLWNHGPVHHRYAQAALTLLGAKHRVEWIRVDEWPRLGVGRHCDHDRSSAWADVDGHTPGVWDWLSTARHGSSAVADITAGGLMTPAVYRQSCARNLR